MHVPSREGQAISYERSRVQIVTWITRSQLCRGSEGLRVRQSAGDNFAADPEGLGQGGDGSIARRPGPGATFPASVGGEGDVQLVGDVRALQAGDQAQIAQVH